MKSLWNEDKARVFNNDPLGMRVYTSRLLGRELFLVLHGGGNTSVKTQVTNLFGEKEDVLYIKGSGWDLATIEAAGFSPVKMNILKKLAELEQLSDSEMVSAQRTAMINPHAPNPSIEAIPHALIPFTFVDHTHADAIVTISNTPDGEKTIRSIYGNKVLVMPYAMPGFILANKIRELSQTINWQDYEGLILLNHGIFTFGPDARISYERMIHLVSQAEAYLEKHAQLKIPASHIKIKNNIELAKIRRVISRVKGKPIIIQRNTTPKAVYFSKLNDIKSIVARGPLTPDHIIRTKQAPVILDEQPEQSIDSFVSIYQEYFNRNRDSNLTCLNPAPCWAVWPGHGTMAFGSNSKEASIISDINQHTIHSILQAEALGGWQVLPEKDLFAIEYWELEQAKLRKKEKTPALQGKVALVTGGAQGIGRSCVLALQTQGATVAVLDIVPGIVGQYQSTDIMELVCDMTDQRAVKDAVERVVQQFSGLDIIVSNAGLFPATQRLEELDQANWEISLQVNLSSHQYLLQAGLPYLELGIDPTVIIMGTRNVSAPGLGAAAYSVAKAGLTQLARVAALELGAKGIRVNVLHPHLVFDTKLWTPEVIAQRTQQYGMSIEEYKTNNVLKTEINSRDVANMVCALAGPLFAKTTGAQIPIDGGNERVI